MLIQSLAEAGTFESEQAVSGMEMDRGSLGKSYDYQGKVCHDDACVLPPKGWHCTWDRK